jgi:serine/threonine protein kinase
LKTNTDQPVLGQFLNGRYKTIQILSASTFCDVYITEDSWDDNLRCVVKHLKQKTWHPEKSLSYKRQFANEVLILNQLGTHNQIPQLLDCFENDQGFYLVQELIVGKQLTSKLKNSRHLWSEEQCIEFLDDVLGILDFVHRQGFVHGNLQPNNLLQRHADGRFVLIDFGAAVTIAPTQVKPRVVPIHPSIAPLAIPAIGYTPAEQFAGQICPSSDIYALGMIAIEALIGINPIELQAEPESGEVRMLAHVGVSEALSCLLNKMVRYEFQNRYQSALAVRADLNKLYMKCEDEGVSNEELVSSKAQELQDCFHAVSRSTDDIPESSPVLADDDAKELTKAYYARQIAIACWPKIPPLLSGMGAGMFSSNAVAISLGLYTLFHTTPSKPGIELLERASIQYKLGNIEEAIAIANKIPIASSVYIDAALAKRQWRQEWNQAATQFDVIQAAFNEQRWQDVINAAHATPDIIYWQQQIEPFVTAAKPELEVQAQQLLQEAYHHAADKDFTGALLLIKQISPETPTGAKIKPKLVEYTQKQHIKAQSALQKAYQRAVEKDFVEALQYLAEIPQDTPAYNTAQIKMAEYSQKQDFQEQAQVQAMLNARLPQIAIKPTQLAKSNQTQNPAGNLNPGNVLKEVTPKPMRALVEVR